MKIDMLTISKRWIPVRIILSILISSIIILLGLYRFNDYFYTWIVYFISITAISILGVLSIYYVLPAFRTIESNIKYSNRDKLYLWGIIFLGCAILFAAIGGVLRLPHNFKPIYRLDFERTMRLALLIIYCMVSDLLMCFLGCKVIRIRESLCANKEEKRKIALHGNNDRCNFCKKLHTAEELMTLCSSLFQTAAISGTIFTICSFIFAP